MSIINHNLLRTAGLIQAELVAHSHLYPALTLPKLPWERVERIARSVELARGRDWQAAARQREEELLRAVDELENALTRLTDQVRQRQRAPDDSDASRTVSGSSGAGKRI